MVKDMTTGRPAPILIRFAIPIILSGIFQQLYNMVDSIVVGRYDGINALAAVGASYPVTMVFISIATGGGVGCSVVVSQLFGRQDLTKMKTAVSTALLTMLTVAVVTMAVGVSYCTDLIALLGTPEVIFQSSAAYLEIYTLGIVFLFLYNSSTSIFNALGDSKTPLFFLIGSSLLNIVLDIIFVKELQLSVVGVAWATFIAQGTASILALTTLLRRLSKIKTDEKPALFDKGILRHMVTIAVPSILQFSTVAVGQLMVQSLVNGFGEVVIAGYAAAIKIDSFFKVPLQTIGTAVSSFSAQNYGANQIPRIKEGYKAAAKLMVGYCLVAITVVFLWGDHLVGLFTSGDSGADVIAVSMSYLRVLLPFFVIFLFMMLGNGVLRGTGRMGAFTFATVVDLFLRVGLSFLLVDVFGYQAIWWAVAVGWCVGSVISTGAYLGNKTLNPPSETGSLEP